MCVLRVTGVSFDAEQYLRTSVLTPYKVFRAGEPRFSSRPDRVHQTSGFSVDVSRAPWSDLRGQIADACRFLEQHADELRVLTGLSSVEDIRLDFPSELRIGRNNVVAQFDYFPPELLKAAGDLGVGIELSTYPATTDASDSD
jgi:hypothetical protein